MTARGRSPHRIVGIARTIAPRGDRQWIDAMLAELDAVELEQRSAWIHGALSIAWASVRMRLATLPRAIWCGMMLAACAVVAFTIAAHSETELVLTEDDVFLPLAWASTVLLVGFGVLAITWIHKHVEVAVRRSS